MKIKTKTKKTLLRILRTTMILCFALNLIEMIVGVENQSYAASGFNLDNLLDAGGSVGIIAALGLLMGGIPLVILNVLKLVIIVVGLVLQALISGVYSSLEAGIHRSEFK